MGYLACEQALGKKEDHSYGDHTFKGNKKVNNLSEINKVFRAGYCLSLLRFILLQDALNIDISVNCDRLPIEENAWTIVTV